MQCCPGDAYNYIARPHLRVAFLENVAADQLNPRLPISHHNYQLPFSATTTLAGMLAVGSNALNVLSNGNVGIGTVSPNTKFEVCGTSGATIRVTGNGTNGTVQFNGTYGLLDNV